MCMPVDASTADMDDSKLLIKELVKSHEKLCTNLGELSTNLGHFMADNTSGTLEGSKVTDDEVCVALLYHGIWQWPAWQMDALLLLFSLP